MYTYTSTESATLTTLANELLDTISKTRKLGPSSARNYAVGYLVAQLGEERILEIIKEIAKDS